MDLYKIIRELVEERNRLQRIIESLEGMAPDGRSLVPVGGKRRGRKSMDTAAREEVSQRMKRYWARRRAEREAARTRQPAEMVVVAGSAGASAGYNATV
jgi:hypothetical protein